MASPFISETQFRERALKAPTLPTMQCKDGLRGLKSREACHCDEFFFPTTINITYTCLPVIGFNGPWSRVPAPGLALTFPTHECNTVYSSYISTGLWKNMSSPRPTWTSSQESVIIFGEHACPALTLEGNYRKYQTGPGRHLHVKQQTCWSIGDCVKQIIDSQKIEECAQEMTLDWKEQKD